MPSGDVIWIRPGVPPLVFLIVPFSTLIVFPSLIGAALWWRRTPDVHKRLMLIGTLELTPAGIARWAVFAPYGPLAYFGLSDLFVLATRNEGWANVFLEAMACGLPVVATDVGGNAEVVANANVGIVVPFADPDRLAQAIADALARDWDRDAIVAYAESNSWERCVRTLAGEFAAIAVRHAATDAHRRGSPGKRLLRS